MTVASVVAVLAVYAHFSVSPAANWWISTRTRCATYRFVSLVAHGGGGRRGPGAGGPGRFLADPAFVLTWTAFSLFLLYKLKIVPEHFWLARRFVPIILPGAIVLACYALFGWRVFIWTGGRTRGKTNGFRNCPDRGSGRLVAVVGSHYAAAAAPWCCMSSIATSFRMSSVSPPASPSDLVIMESRNAESDIHVLGLPLAYIYAKPVLVLDSPKPDLLRFQYVLEHALKIRPRVFCRHRRHDAAVEGNHRDADRQRSRRWTSSR